MVLLDCIPEGVSARMRPAGSLWNYVYILSAYHYIHPSKCAIQSTAWLFSLQALVIDRVAHQFQIGDLDTGVRNRTHCRFNKSWNILWAGLSFHPAKNFHA